MDQSSLDGGNSISQIPLHAKIDRAIPLHEKIDRTISDAPQGEPKSVFISHIWPSLETDYGLFVLELKKYCDQQLREEGIPAKVDGRAKATNSIKSTIDRRETDRIKRLNKGYKYPREIFGDMHDLAGIRIVVDYPSDLDKADQRIRSIFQVKKEPNVFHRNRQVGKLWEAWFGAYQSVNHHVTLRPDASGVLRLYCEVIFEVQLTTLPESLYNRLAHPLLYKNLSGDLSRKDEMVIDMSHGVALCYSLCLLYMEDKLEKPKRLEKQESLRDAMRKAVPAIGAEQSDEDMNELVESIPNIPSIDKSTTSAQGGTSSRLKRRASFGKTLQIESLLSTLHMLPEGCDSSDALWAYLTSQLEYVRSQSTRRHFANEIL